MKNCKKCGAMIPDEAMFCTSCGTKIENDFEGTTVLDDSLSSYDAGIFEETEPADTTVLNEQDWDETSVLDDPAENMPKNKEVHSAFVNPNFQQNSAQQFNSIPNQENPSQNKMPYLDFFDKFASKKTKGNIKTTGIIAIITSVLSLALVAMGNYLSVIDLIVYAVLAVLILKKKSWIFTLVLACYSGLFTIIGLVMSGTPSGIFALVMAIMATINGKKLSDAYNNYIATGAFPVSEI